MRAFTERSQSERTAAEGEGGMEGRRKGGREDSEREREREREGGWGVVIARSFQAVEVRRRRRENKLLLMKERRDRKGVWISELLNSFFFLLPFSPLHGS